MAFPNLLFALAVIAFCVLIIFRALQTYGLVRRFRYDLRQQPVYASEVTVEEVGQILEDHRVSVLLPAWNERENLPFIMSDLANLSLPNIEVLISAGGDDGTFAVAEQVAKPNPGLFRVFEQPGGHGKQRALRDLFERATGDIIYLLDADCRVDDGLIAATVSPILLRGETATTTQGQPLATQFTNPVATALLVTRLDLFIRQTQYVVELNGQNAACRSAWAAQSQVFEREAPIGTDYVMARALLESGEKIRLVRHEWVQTEFELEIGPLARQLSRWTRNSWYHNRELPAFGLVLTVAWWTTLLVGTLAMLPASLVMVPLAVAYLYASHAGLYILSDVFPGKRVHHATFLSVALLYQAIPLLALRDHLDPRSRTKW